MAGQATIRCDPLDGEWQTLGAGRYRGVVPEGIEASANSWGPDQLSFEVKATEPGALRPDLLPFTPVELEVDGELVWAGRVKARPSDERAFQVSCEGWQYHLDDDNFERVYVHTQASDYVDVRQSLLAQLGASEYCAVGQVSASDNATTLMYPNAQAVVQNGRCGVLLDLGPDSTAKRVVLQWESSNNSASFTLYCRGMSAGPFGSGDAGLFDDAFNIVNNSGASGTTAGTFTTARRYVLFFSFVNGASHTPPADVWFRLKNVQVFRLTAYESGNASILKSDVVAADALPAAPLLNQNTQYIAAGTFNIPEYRTQGYQSPREILESVNAYENYELRIGGHDLKTLVFGPKATVPSVVAGEWAGAQFSDSSVAGDDIYDQVTVTGVGPDNTVLVRKRSQTGTLVDRQGFHRTKVLPIRSAGVPAVYDRFGDLWLGDHQLSPFAGKLAATNGLRRWLGGSELPPQSLLLLAGARVHLAHRVDPDTGAWGRDGQIVGVRYKHSDRSVEVDVDDRRDHFESILQRYGILVDQFLR